MKNLKKPGRPKKKPGRPANYRDILLRNRKYVLIILAIINILLPLGVSLYFIWENMFRDSTNLSYDDINELWRNKRVYYNNINRLPILQAHEQQADKIAIEKISQKSKQIKEFMEKNKERAAKKIQQRFLDHWYYPPKTKDGDDGLHVKLLKRLYT